MAKRWSGDGANRTEWKAKRWGGDGANTTGERLRDGAVTERQQWTNSTAMGRQRGDENGREAIGEEKGECRF